MHRKRNTAGFSLIELLLVVAVMGIIAAIAIPSFLGQRRRARVIGDAESNAQVLRMQLETYKADNAVYGVAGTVYNWTAAGGPDANAAALLPGFTLANSKLDFAVTVANAGLTYQINVTDPNLGNAQTYETDQTGAALFVMH